jgi:endoglucanase
VTRNARGVLPLFFAFGAIALTECGKGGDGASPGSSSDGGTSTPGASASTGSVASSGTFGSSGGSRSSSGGTGGSDASSPAGDGSTGIAPDGGAIVAPQSLSPFIVVDQFGYRPGDEKVAVLRNPQTGADSSTHFSPGTTYALVDAHAGNAKAFEGTPVAWNGGATDTSSGDQAWRFDFSSVTAPGDYYVLDETRNVRSDVFRVSSDVYRVVLTQAVRMLYYQRDGIAKDAKYAGAGWADGVAHPQDAQCVTFDTKSTPRDLHGGWFDAGDQNRYSSWGATDVIQLLRAYAETPDVFTDDWTIPESGNGVPDVLDEARWEIDWLRRMQNADGSVLSIAGHAGASPPSSDASTCLYAPVTTSASLSAAAVFALASTVYKPFDSNYAATLLTAAQSAWTWAVANPAVVFHNGGKGVGAGDPELDAYGLAMRQLEAALYLYEATGTASYRQYFDANYAQAHMIAYGNYADMFEGEAQETLLDYTKASGATGTVQQAIRSAYKAGMAGNNSFGAVQADKDPYLAFIYTYTWGSNANRAAQGTMFYDVVSYGIDATQNAAATRAAERFVHYFHGVNPLGLVYLSNMGAYGAATSVTRFFHSWFAHGSAKWDGVGTSTYGPPPGYLPGGPNPGYALDGCCPGSCGVTCPATPSPPAGQPSQKSYAQINDAWPVDSWSVTEPDDGYQVNYIRLLAKFAK